MPGYKITCYPQNPFYGGFVKQPGIRLTQAPYTVYTCRSYAVEGEIGGVLINLSIRRLKMSVKLTWYGHATLGVETGGYQILRDPYFTGNPAASTSADNVEAD